MSSVFGQMHFVETTTSQYSFLAQLRQPLLEQCTNTTCYGVYNGSFCYDSKGSSIIDYPYCNCIAIPGSDGIFNGLYAICGLNQLEVMAKSYYNRAAGVGLFLGQSESSECLDSIKRMACFMAYKECVPAFNASYNYMGVCRNACYSIKSSCGVSEDCSNLPESWIILRSNPLQYAVHVKGVCAFSPNCEIDQFSDADPETHLADNHLLGAYSYYSIHQRASCRFRTQSH
ncbi:hypothetical protein PROFUN_13292 [Planoprotostelium fungivorum]|uniref:Uncharacterized protein n=1 Tax=Planoprotostelium fungivorum TaxID=1890364 RepID=A0A2P6N4N5_9EUKA|nr:hypothetical protein PROFUN_13292 [Planoprotostelium fungivorum]